MKTSTDKKANDDFLAPVLKSIIFVLWVIEIKKSIRHKIQRINLSALFFALLITSTLYVTATSNKPSTPNGLKLNTFLLNQVISF